MIVVPCLLGDVIVVPCLLGDVIVVPCLLGDRGSVSSVGRSGRLGLPPLANGSSSFQRRHPAACQ